MQARSPVPLVVGGQTYRIVANVPEGELRRLAGVVEERVRALVPPGKQPPPTAILLAAIALAHDLDDERAQRAAFEVRSRDTLRRLLARIDAALDGSDGERVDEPSPPPGDVPARFT